MLTATVEYMSKLVELLLILCQQFGKIDGTCIYYMKQWRYAKTSTHASTWWVWIQRQRGSSTSSVDLDYQWRRSAHRYTGKCQEWAGKTIWHNVLKQMVDKFLNIPWECWSRALPVSLWTSQHPTAKEGVAWIWHFIWHGMHDRVPESVSDPRCWFYCPSWPSCKMWNL